MFIWLLTIVSLSLKFTKCARIAVPYENVSALFTTAHSPKRGLKDQFYI